MIKGETHGSTTTDLYYSNRWQVVQENVGSLVTAEHVWSPFYVDAMIQTVTNPQVTANQSNGTVDSGFGMNTSNHTTTTTLSSTPTAAVSAADGSDIVVGIVASTTPELLFYNASGGLDTAFGSGSGTVSLSSVNATSIAGMLVQSNGKIDLAIQNSSGGMTVVQLNADGSLDTGFNGSGIQSLSSLPAAGGIVLARNGDLLVAGVSGNSVVSAELSPTDGSLITGYNSSGTSSVSMGGSWSSLTFLSMAEAPNGDLVVAGDAAYYSDGTLTNDAVLIAVRADGSSFGAFGVVNAGALTLAPGYSAMAISPAGQIYFGLATGTTSVVLKAIEFNSDGSVDTAFGTGGTASTGTISGNGSGLILQIQLNGEIVIGAGGSGSSGHFIVARFNPNGTKDTSFGTSGIKIGVAEGGGLSMVMAANGETIIIGKAPSGTNGIILEEFDTLATKQTYYVEYDADYNVTSISNSSGGVIERYCYDPYGNVTVEKASGATLGNGSANGSLYGWVYLHQGLRLDVLTGLDDDRKRQTYSSVNGRFLQEDPTHALYVNGSNLFQFEDSTPIFHVDPTGQDICVVRASTGSRLHEWIVVGDPSKDAMYYSFGMDDDQSSLGPFYIVVPFRGGVVYSDGQNADPNPIIEEQLPTTPDQDNQFEGLLKSMAHPHYPFRSPYGLIYPNCRTFSHDMFDLAKKSYGPPPPSTPPADLPWWATIINVVAGSAEPISPGN